MESGGNIVGQPWVPWVALAGVVVVALAYLAAGPLLAVLIAVVLAIVVFKSAWWITERFGK